MARKIGSAVLTYRATNGFQWSFAMSDSLQTITLGGGCFWCTEAVFVKVRGVTDVESGYSNGHVQRPSYEQVCTGSTGHNEVVKLEYDLAQISLREILEIFFVIHDPTTLNRRATTPAPSTAAASTSPRPNKKPRPTT